MEIESKSIKQVGADVAASAKELATNWRLRAHLMEYVTRRPQCGMQNVSQDLSERLGMSQSTIRRELPALFGDRRPWTPPSIEEQHGDPLVCSVCEFTTALTKQHVGDLFGWREDKRNPNNVRVVRQGQCRWCRTAAGRAWETRCDEGAPSGTTRIIWLADGMLFDKLGRVLKESERTRSRDWKVPPKRASAAAPTDEVDE